MTSPPRRQPVLLPLTVLVAVAAVLTLAITHHTGRFDIAALQHAHASSIHPTQDHHAPEAAKGRIAPDPDAGRGRNAALIYLKFHVFSGIYLRDFKLEYFDSLPFDVRHGEWLMTESLRDTLAEFEPHIDSLAEASRLPYCNFEAAEDIAAGMPFRMSVHIGVIQNVHRYLGYDARRLMAEGQPDRAAGRIAATIRLAEQVTRHEPLWLHSLLASTTLSSAKWHLKTMVERGQLTPEGRRQIRSAIDLLDRDDPVRAAQSIPYETDLFETLATRWIEAAAADSQAAITKTDAFDGTIRDALIDAINAQNEEAIAQVSDDLLAVVRFGRDLAEVWHDDNERALLVTRAEEGKYGPFADEVWSTYARGPQSFALATENLDEIDTLLDEPARDAADPAD